MSERKQRILFVLHSLKAEGAQRLVYQLSCELKERFEIGILCLDSKGELWVQCEDQGFSLFCIERKPGWSLSNFSRISAVMRKFRPDVIHAHQYTPYFYSAFGKIFGSFGATLVFTEHGRHVPDVVRPLRRVVNSLLLRVTNSITAVSEFTRLALIQKEGIQSRTISVIRNGLFEDSSSEAKDVRVECGIEADSSVIGFIGAFRDVKNPAFLLDAFAELAKRKPLAHLVYIGDGPLRNEIEGRVADLGLQKKVHFLGLKNPAAPFASSFDVFVLPSKSEASPLALLEAMSRNVPVVVTDRGGAQEIVTHGETGLVVPLGDISALEGAIIRLLEDSEFANKISSRGQKLVLSEYKFQSMVDSYVELYETGGVSEGAM